MVQQWYINIMHGVPHGLLREKRESPQFITDWLVAEQKYAGCWYYGSQSMMKLNIIFSMPGRYKEGQGGLSLTNF